MGGGVPCTLGCAGLVRGSKFRALVEGYGYMDAEWG
jgi:hypothetical protein